MFNLLSAKKTTNNHGIYWTIKKRKIKDKRLAYNFRLGLAFRKDFQLLC
jgi:hypothetical protein